MTFCIGRREFITLFGSAAVAWPLAAHAQTKRLRRIGVLMGLVANDPEAQSRVAAFENGLRELGWVKGGNLSIEYRWAGDGSVLRDHAAELLATVPDLILANSTPVTTALQEQSRSVPIVFTQVTDPVGQGLVPNLAHPGGNLTGFTSFEFSIGTKWLEALKQTAPRVTRVALVFNPQSAPSADLFLLPVEAAAPSFSVVPIGAAVRDTGSRSASRMIATICSSVKRALRIAPSESGASLSRNSWSEIPGAGQLDRHSGRSTIETIHEVRLKQFCARFERWVEQASQPARS
jgi:putative tryptophan/tyrosine transport system substrate-binding protein